MSINRVTSPNRSLLNNADGGRSGPGIVAIAATPPLLSLVACSASQQRPIQAGRLQAACVDSRSQIFTMDYTPVCATRDSGRRCVMTPCDTAEHATYANACGACADPRVIYHLAGACPE